MRKEEPKQPRRAAIYSRKSRYTGRGESVGNQVELCRAHIRSLWGEEQAREALVFEDEGFSGGNLNRPDFRRMMARARAGELSAIVVYRLDRISRSIGDFAALIQELDRLDVAFLSIKEQFDTGSPMGRAMMYIASVFSQLERETIAERIRDNLRELAKTGRWLGGVTPLGFASESERTVTVDGKAKRSCRLRLVPEEAETVRRIYRLYLETGSLTRTAEALGELRTRQGLPFTRYALRAILENPVYLTADGAAQSFFLRRGADVYPGPRGFDGRSGVLAYHRTRQERGHVRLPVEEWIVSVGRHPGLISSRDWLAVQDLLERNRSSRPPRGSGALLTGLLRCRCGGAMYPKASRAPGRFSYVCREKSQSRGAACACPNPPGPELDRAVLEALAALESPPPEGLAPLPDCLERLPPELCRRALREVIREAVWDGGGARIRLSAGPETLRGEDGK